MRPTPPSRATTRSDGTHGGLRFGILGPVEVTFGQTPVRIPSGRQRAVLCALLLTPNEVVSVDSLVAAVWAGRPPATAKGQIQVCVAALRRTLGRFGADQLIETRPPGYLLRVAADRIDSSVFAAKVAAAAAAEREGHLDEAVQLLRVGLALWRGRALVETLAESRLTALETCMDLELRLGRTPVDELTALVHEHPLRERLRGQLMTALFKAGRPADALEVYWAGWRIMLDELDVEPGEELRRLEAEILAHTQLPPDPAPRTGPRQLPAAIADFTGREALVEAALSTNQILVITGQAGIGKTALALHVAHRLAERFPDGQLYHDLAGTQRTPADPSDVLARFLHALGAQVPNTLDERAATYRAILTNRQVLVVLDNAASAQQVTPLLPDNGTVILTSRTPLPELPERPGTRVLDVPPLPQDHALALLSKVIGSRRVTAEPTAATTLAKLAQSPLKLRIVAARLAARPHWSLASMVTRLSEEHQTLAPRI